MANKANTDAACPYCGDVRSQPAQARYKCKSCGNAVWIKSSVDNRQKRPMAKQQAEDAEQEWQDQAHEKLVDKFQWLSEQVQRTTDPGKVQGHFLEMATIQHRLGNDPMPYLAEAHQADLNSMPPEMVRAVVIVAHNPCGHCEQYVGRVIPLGEAKIINLLPVEHCWDLSKRGWPCGTRYEVVFDDE